MSNEIHIITIGSPDTTDYNHVYQHLDTLLANVQNKPVTIYVPKMGCVSEPLFQLYATEKRYNFVVIKTKPEDIHEVFNQLVQSATVKEAMIGYVGFGSSDIVQQTHQIAQQLNIKARRITR